MLATCEIDKLCTLCDIKDLALLWNVSQHDLQYTSEQSSQHNSGELLQFIIEQLPASNLAINL